LSATGESTVISALAARGYKAVDTDYGGLSELVDVAPSVANTFSGRARFAQPALVNGTAGAVWAPGGRTRVVFGFKIAHGRIDR
jgi:hypothetical protein